MPKKTNLVNWRIEVMPHRPLYYEPTERQWRAACEAVLHDIRRHVDGVQSMAMNVDRVSICSYCGRNWTEESDDFNGGCCDEDMKHEPKENGND